jgi:signal transduction histidine kinase
LSWRQSLRVRLLLLGAVAVVVTPVVAGIFILASFRASIEAERRDDLQASLDRLIAAIDPDAVELAGPQPLSDPRYDTPLSGLYWQIDDRDSGEVVRSRSLWDQQLAPASLDRSDATGQLSEAIGPARERLIVLSRAVTADSTSRGERHFIAAVAERRDQDEAPVRRFGLDLAGALTVLGVVLTIAGALQVHFGLQPLQTLRRQVAGIRHGESRQLPADGPEELDPVIQQVNELLEAQEASIGFARQRAADLAHGLKTPLAVLSATSERLRAAGDQANADLLQMLAEQMNARIDYQLRIARLRFRTRAQGASSSLNETVLRSIAVLRKSHDGEALNWLVDLEEDLRADIDEHDLMELTGIVLENAAKWAATRVRTNAERRAGEVQLVVEDDGAGLTDEQIKRLGVRGTRLDESAPGEGLGLAIAFEIVRLNRGSILVERGRLGGLCVRITLPAA